MASIHEAGGWAGLRSFDRRLPSDNTEYQANQCDYPGHDAESGQRPVSHIEVVAIGMALGIDVSVLFVGAELP